MNVLIGNIISFIAAVLMVYTGMVLKKKKIIILQMVQMLLLTISNIILGSIPGAISDLIGTLRNYLYYKGKINFNIKLIIVVATIIISLYFNNLGIIGILPILSVVLYTLFIDLENIKHFKIVIIITFVMWFIHDFYVKSYVMAVMDLLSITTNIVSIYKANSIKK